jgi:hypothetical protein
MGYILDGVYHKEVAPIEKLQSRQQSTFKQHDQNRQRKDFAREILQPHDKNGKPNEDFIAAYNEESKEYGFLPTDKDLKNG